MAPASHGFPCLHRRQRPQRDDLHRLTDDLSRRIGEHKTRARAGFTKTYGRDRLVWFESFHSRSNAFRRERQIKEWRRSWKLLLIEEGNPTWRNLYEVLNGEAEPGGALGPLGDG